MKLWLGIGLGVAIIGYSFEILAYRFWCWFWRKAEDLD